MPNTPDPQAAKAEALLLRFAAEAHRRKWSYDRGLDGDGVPIKSEAFDALHQLGEEMRTALEELRRTPAVSPSAVVSADRATLLREAADVAREEAHRLETGNHDARAARGARSVAYLLRRMAIEADANRVAAEAEDA